MDNNLNISIIASEYHIVDTSPVPPGSKDYICIDAMRTTFTDLWLFSQWFQLKLYGRTPSTKLRMNYACIVVICWTFMPISLTHIYSNMYISTSYHEDTVKESLLDGYNHPI